MAKNDKEIWKQIPFPKGSTTRNYAISSHGRIASFDNDINDRLVLSMHDHEGYTVCTTRVSGKSRALFPHQLMGALFLKKHNPKCKFVIHLDHNKKNNLLSNLKWATPKELAEHTKKSPHVLNSIKHRVYNGYTAKKLNEKKVIQLKKELWNPERKLTFKQLAAKYDIAEMNLYRIKSGEMWYHVHVEGEPVHPKYKNHLKNIEYHEKLKAKEEAVKKKKEAEREVKRRKLNEKRKRETKAKKKQILEHIAKAKQSAKHKKDKSKNASLKKTTSSKLKKKQESFIKKQIAQSKKKIAKKDKKKLDKKNKKK